MESPPPSDDTPKTEAGQNRTDAPHDLRDWLERIEEAGELHRVTAPVRLDEELGAITYMAARDEDAPALLFDNFEDRDSDTSVVSNMPRCFRSCRNAASGWSHCMAMVITPFTGTVILW